MGCRDGERGRGGLGGKRRKEEDGRGRRSMYFSINVSVRPTSNKKAFEHRKSFTYYPANLKNKSLSRSHSSVAKE